MEEETKKREGQAAPGIEWRNRRTVGDRKGIKTSKKNYAGCIGYHGSIFDNATERQRSSNEIREKGTCTYSPSNEKS